METLEIVVALWISIALGFALYILLFNVVRKRKQSPKIRPEELTVIIPFRNEESRIRPLLQSLKAQKQLPAAFIFVDDHSTDNGKAVIQQELSESAISFATLSLSHPVSGKKKAVFEGVKTVNTPYTLTLDADVVVPADYFSALPDPGSYAMICLPVRMTGATLVGKFMELEYGSFQLLQGSVPENDPLMASGANLLFVTKDYLTYNDLSQHDHLLSGDDQFALSQFKKQGRKVRYTLHPEQTVVTPVPESIGALIRQRIRWMANNSGGTDSRATFFAGLVVLINLTYPVSFLLLVVQADYPLAFRLFIVRFCVDFITYIPWFTRYQNWSLAFYLPLLQFFYPLLLCSIGLGSLFIHKEWKNRSVEQQ